MSRVSAETAVLIGMPAAPGIKQAVAVALSNPIMADAAAPLTVIPVYIMHPMTVGAKTAVRPDTAYISRDIPSLQNAAATAANSVIVVRVRVSEKAFRVFFLRSG